jgi:WD40 repeat protein
MGAGAVDAVTGEAAGRISLGGPGVRALVVGTGDHVAGSELPDIPAVAETARDLGNILVSRCGLDKEQVRVLVDPESPGDIARSLHESAEEATDVLVFVYIGHGLPDLSGELHLATRSATGLGSALTYQALAFGSVRRLLADCRARSVLVILDCCYAGMAQGVFGAAVGNAFGAAQLAGGCLLAAAAPDEVALAPYGQRHTAFTGALIDLLENGDPTGPPALTVDYAFRHLDRVLQDRKLPRPQRYVTASGGEVLLAPNRGYAPPDVPLAPLARSADDDLLPCPYRGLSAYQPGDARFFFGREELAGTLAGRIAQHSWQHGPLMVLGASGVGKSSLLAAGLIPALHDGRFGQLPGSQGWQAMIVTPGTDPVGMLRSRLGPRARPPGAHARHAAESRLLLIIDQFEELFTQCADPAERVEFARALRELCQPGPGGGLPPALVVAVTRADFYLECTTVPELAEALEQGPMVVGPMTAEQVRAAIERPAREAGAALESGLAARLLHDLGTGTGPDQAAGSLPLLSHALVRTWQARSGRTLTLAGYQASGGIAHAVEVTAEKVYGGLDTGGRDAARRILLCLVRVGDGTEDTRRRVPLAELIAAVGDGGDQLARRVIAELVSERLVEADGTHGDPRDAASAQIAHEALLRAWPRLREWIREDRDWLSARQSLAEAASEWAQEGRDPSGLYQGRRLASARAALADRRAELSAAEKEFLDGSIRHEQAGRRRRIQRVLAASLAVLLVAVGGATAYVVKIRESNAQLTRVVTSQQLAAQSIEALSGAGSSPYDADLHALAGWGLLQNSLTRGALLSAGERSYSGKFPGTGIGEVWSLAATSDGRLVAAGGSCASPRAGSNCGTLRIWDAASRRLLLNRTYPGPVSSLAFSPNGAALAVTYEARKPSGVQIWDTAGLRPRLRFTFGRLPGSPLAFSPDGKIVASITGDAFNIVLREVASGTPVMTLRVPARTLTYSLAFGPRGHLLAAGEYNDTTSVWDTSTGHVTRVLGRPSESFPHPTVAFSPDGTILATSNANSIQTWHVPGLTPDATYQPDGANNFVDTMAFSANGGELLAGDDSDIYTWDVASGSLLNAGAYDGTNDVTKIAVTADGIFSGYANGDVAVQDEGDVPVISGQPIMGAAIAPAGGLIAVGGGDGYVRLWNPLAGSPIRPLRAGTPVTALAFSPGGNVLAAAGPGQVTVWDTGTGRPERGLPVPGGDAVQVLQIGYGDNGSFLAADVWPVSDTGPHAYIEVWDTRTWRPILTITAPLAAPQAFALPAAGTELAVTEGRVIQLWNLGDRKLTAHWPVSGEPGRLAFVPGTGDRLLVAGNSDGTVTEWDTVTRQPARSLQGVFSQVHALGVSPDGTQVAVAGQDSTISIYSLTDGSLIATLVGDTQRFNSLVFSRDGTRLLSTSGDGTAIWWNLSPADVVDRLCQAVSGPALPAAWRQLAGATASPC